MKSLIQCGLLLFTVVYGGYFHQHLNFKERNQVKEAVLNYVEGVYEADTTKIYESVHPDLVKRGTSYNSQTNEYSPFKEMTFEQLVGLTKRWNKDGTRANSETIREVIIYDVQDKTATAKVIAAWGTDYFHLAKLDDKWYIMNVLWQSQKPQRTKSS